MNSIFQVLTLAWSLQGGQYFNNAVNDNGVFTTNNNYFIQTSFELRVPMSWTKGAVNNFFIGADTENQFAKLQTADWTFSPWQDTYKFNLGIRFFETEFGFQHECTHPIVFSQAKKPSQYIASYDKIYIKVSSSF